MVREEDREHMAQIREHVETSMKEETLGSRARMEMRGRVQVIHEDQDRSLENGGAREGRMQCPRKGILRGIQRWKRSR